jgi:hypothetical protein
MDTAVGDPDPLDRFVRAQIDLWGKACATSGSRRRIKAGD